MSDVERSRGEPGQWRNDLAVAFDVAVSMVSRGARRLAGAIGQVRSGAVRGDGQGRVWAGIDALAGKKFRLLVTVTAVVLVLSALKAIVHGLSLEFLTLNPLVTSAIGGAIFLIGFLLSGVLADYKESERLPGEIRVSLEALHDDISMFCSRSGKADPADARDTLRRIVTTLRECLGGGGTNENLVPVLAEVDRLAILVDRLEGAGMTAGAVVRLKNTLDSLRRSFFRIYHVQATQFVPSVHILVQTLVTAILFLLLFLTTEGTFQSSLFFGFIAYIFVYALYLIEMLEQPFRKGTGSMDDVSLFLLYEFAEKLKELDGAEPGR